MSLPSDVTVDNLKDFYAMILPYLNVGNGGTSDTPLGQVAFFDDVVAPAGWLIADGTVYNISDYPDLANQYERVHGSKNFYGGNGTTTFAVPDWQGEFLRASGTNSHANQGSGAAVGVHQDGTSLAYIYKYNEKIIGANTQTKATTDLTADKTYGDVSGYSSAGTTQGQDEVPAYIIPRPTNTSLLLCIKAVPSSEMNTYSLTERRVGTWIDGKPLYQKVFANNGSAISFPISVANLNIDTLVYLDGLGSDETTYSTNGARWMLSNVSGLSGKRVLFIDASKQIQFQLPQGYIFWVVARYTKTTD